MKFEQYDLVVMHDNDDSQVYQIDEITPKYALLSYQDHYKTVKKGRVHIDYLKKPTRKQLENSGLL